ncbi:MAG: hypothetical protein CM15mV2_1710 [uncultured marine virus]|nr:MAG: hypothetical protein CM15mV2_1710 [uncultured marine virus]
MLKINLDKYKFAVITFEHDKYNDGDSVQNESRQYLQDRGYILIVDDISVDDQHPFEDWWAHPDLVDGNIIAAMKCVQEKLKSRRLYVGEGMKIILWGYPLHTDTYSYIYEAFKKAFEHQGYEVHWFTDEAHPHDFDYDNCLFFCEGYRDKKIPLRKTSTYVCHVCVNPEKYLGNVKKLIDMRYHVDYMTDVNYTYKVD